jgi:hypothetical protein
MSQPSSDDPIAVSTAYNKEDADRWFQLRKKRLDILDGFMIGLVIFFVIASVLGLIGFIVNKISDEHARQVKVWCYADPNRDSSTSEFVGSPDNVKGLCPDASSP